MAEQEIKIEISADGTAAISSMGAVSDAARDMGKTVEKSGTGTKLALWGAGEAAENLAQSMGVPTQMGRRLGDTFQDMISRAGGVAVAFGGISLAIMAGLGIYNLFVERNKKLAEEAAKAAEAKAKLRDETIKAGQAASEWLLKADRHIDKSREMAAAEWEVYKAEYARNKLALEKGILEEQQKILDLKAKSMDYVVLDYNGSRVALRSQTDMNKELRAEVELREKKLALQTQQLKELGGPTLSGMGEDKGEKKEEAQAQRREDMMRAMRERALLIGQAGDARELLQLDIKHQAELAKLQELGASKEEIERAQMIQRAERLDIEAQQDIKRKKKTEEMKQRYEMATLSHAANAFKMMSDLGGKHGRQMFYAYQVAAIGKTIMSTRAAAMKAYEEGGPYLGTALAAMIIAEGAASVALIGRQKYEGGGGSVGAIGTYSANSATGLPENKGYQYYYEQDPRNPSSYGTGWRPGEGTNEQQKVHVEIVVKDQAFVDAVVKNYNDKGSMYDAVNGTEGIN